MQRATAPGWLGWILLLPAVVVLVWQMIVPTAGLLVLSFQRVSVSQQSEWVGLQNWSRLPDVLPSFGFGLLLGSVLLVGLIVCGPLIGLLATAGPPWLATVVRVLLAVQLVIYAPTAMAFGMLMTAGNSPPSILAGTLLIHLPITVGAVGLAVSAAGRGDRSSRRTLLIIAVVAVSVAVSFGLQSFTMPAVLTGGGPGRSTQTPAFASYEYAYQQMVLGQAAMINLLVLIIAAVLGVIVTVVLIKARLDARLDARMDARMDAETEHDPAARPGNPLAAAVPRTADRSTLFGVAAVLVTVGVAVIALVGNSAWVRGLFDLGRHLPENLGAGVVTRSMINDWLPAVIAAAIQVLIAAAAGAGIGYLRPLGERSRWLLLIFAPGLFIGSGPYLVGEFAAVVGADRLGRWVTLIPRPWLSVPALFAFTWMASAIRRRHSETGSWSGLVGPAVGGLVLTLVLLVTVQAQALQRDLVMAPQDRLWSADVLLLQLSRQGFGRELPLWIALPAPVLLAAAALSVAAVWLLRNVRIGTADE